MRTRIVRSIGALVLGLLVGATVLAGCGGGDSGDSGGSGGYVEPKGPATETVAIEAGNFYFKPDAITTNAGIAKIELTAKNGVHDLVFDGAYPGFLLEADGGGGTTSKKIDLKPGTYTFYCSIPGHRAAGMEGTLTVK
jgi:plastocyanin